MRGVLELERLVDDTQQGFRLCSPGGALRCDTRLTRFIRLTCLFHDLLSQRSRPDQHNDRDQEPRPTPCPCASPFATLPARRLAASQNAISQNTVPQTPSSSTGLPERSHDNPAPHDSPRIALVTGGGTGIGKAIAQALADDGHAVVICGRRQEPLDEVARELKRASASSLAVAGDVSSPDDARRIVSTTVEALGGLDVLVNAAGIARFGAIEEISERDIDQLVDIDLKGPLHMIRAALPELETAGQRGDASILNISTNVTQTVVPGYSVYAAAKAGLDTLTRYLALELAPKRIRVNAILPGVVETPIFETLMPREAVSEFLDGFGQQVPLGRVGQPADVARIAAQLCSHQNDWVTGALVPVDGGSALGMVDGAS